MSTKRYYFISKNLDAIENFERDLESEGLSSVQVRVLSNDDVETDRRIDINEVHSLLRHDGFHTARSGAALGVVAALLVVLMTGWLNLPEATAGWAPWILLSVFVFGFCVWEAAFIGFQRPNRQFEHFGSTLRQGKHVVFVDATEKDVGTVDKVLSQHDGLELEGLASGKPTWAVSMYDRAADFIDRNLMSLSSTRNR